MAKFPSEQDILSYFRTFPDLAFTVSELARHFRVQINDKKELRLLLRSLVGAGHLQRQRRSFVLQTVPKAPKPEAVASLQPDKPAKNELDEPSVQNEIQKIITELKLPEEFPPSVLAAAEALDGTISKEELAQRHDLRKKPIVTIDGHNARDFDDAVYVEEVEHGFRLYVSIADVSHYVRPGDVIDQEAAARGTSVYFPHRVLPMLPERLSNQLCSLVPGEDRLTLTAEIDFDEKGRVRDSRFYRSVIHSHYRFTYQQVASVLREPESETAQQLSPILRAQIQVMAKLYQQLRKQRLERGSLDFDLPESEVIINLEEDRIERIIKAERTQAHMLIEEFMIAANEAVARQLTEAELPTVYRIHEAPSTEKLLELQSVLHNLGYQIKISKKTVHSRVLADVIARSQQRPESRMVKRKYMLKPIKADTLS